MKPILSCAQARAFDTYAIEQAKVPSIVLMENAGRLAADCIVHDALGSGKGARVGGAVGARVVVVCGTGNNGGDGFVVARHLFARGADVRVFRVGSHERMRGDARANHDAYEGIGGVIEEIATDADRGELRRAVGGASVVVDALFGTGLHRAIDGKTAETIDVMNSARGVRVAIDLPSGLDGDTGAALGACFHADITVTFGHYKLGLLTPHGARVAGRVHVADLGVPSSLGDPNPPSAELVERSDVAKLLPPRHSDVHKHTAGHVGVFAGSDGKIGASLMVARGALRAGAGLATIATWTECATLLQGRVLEEMTATLTRDDVAKSVDAAIAGKRALAVGPGFGLDDAARSVVERLAGTWKGPALFDADALTLAAGRPEMFASMKVSPVLTPHGGECARLLGISSQAVEQDRFSAARALAKKARAVVVLKGAYTLIADAAGRVVVSSTGGPALATAGSGDTLGGIIAALLCTLDPFDAAVAGVYVHGLAADSWSEAHGDRGLLASEIADGVPEVLAALTREHTRAPD